MNKYEKLDPAILDAIGDSVLPSGLINADTAVCSESQRIAADERNAAGEGRSSAAAWRIVDRRLQALRKSGQIRFDGRGWSKS